MLQWIAGVTLLLVSACSLGQQSAFDGTWRNVDANTRGITHITVNGEDIHPYGRCHPTDCDWGVVHGHIEMAHGDQPTKLKAIHIESFARVAMMLTVEPSGQLGLSTFTHFTDNSNRADYSARNFYRRVLEDGSLEDKTQPPAWVTPEERDKLWGNLPPGTGGVHAVGGRSDYEKGVGPVYPVGGGVTAPVAVHVVEAEYTDEARHKKVNGHCVLSVLVDPQGRPQDVEIVKSLEDDLDQNAVKAVKRYRFKPAMRDGKPVAVKVTVEVDFSIY